MEGTREDQTCVSLPTVLKRVIWTW